jgi:hypothetical protein
VSEKELNKEINQDEELTQTSKNSSTIETLDNEESPASKKVVY